MKGNIYINGLIGTIIDAKGNTEKGVELLDVILQVKNQPKADSFNVYITSPGGVITTGIQISDYLRSLKKPIKTIGQELVASIATDIYMSGDERELKKGTRFYLHLPQGGIKGTSDDISLYASRIKEVEAILVSRYQERTGLSENEILPLLQKETFLTDVEAFKLGFSNIKAMEIEPVAYFNKNKLTQKLMSKESKKGIWNKLQDLFKEEGITNKLVYDAEQKEIDFYELADDDSVTVGAKARVDGKDADGTYVVPSEDDAEKSVTYVFADGELAEIVEAEIVVETTEDDTEDMAALKVENDALKAKVLEFENKLSKKDTAITNFKEKNKNLNSFIAKIKALESDEEIVTGLKEKTKPETKESTASKFGSAITNLKNKKENGL